MSVPMKRKFTTLMTGMFLLVFMSVGCAEDKHPIIQGTYLSPSGDESVSVSGTEIHFHIRGGGLRRDRILDHTYPQYSVWNDGSINPSPMTSDDAGGGIGWFEWIWDGEKILQKNPRTSDPARPCTRKP